MFKSRITLSRMKRPVVLAVIFSVMITQWGCATGNGKNIALGMMGGAVVGAAVGHQFVHHGQHKQYESQNTILTSAIFSLAVGGALAWHYNELQEQTVELSGRYARYRLCDPDDLCPNLANKLQTGGPQQVGAQNLSSNQYGKFAITLDDHTKWTYPTFRKRFLPPDRSETQVISSRYIWEILKPGSFVTRSQNPQYFLEGDEIK